MSLATVRSILMAGGAAFAYDGPSEGADLLQHLAGYETAAYGSSNYEDVTFNVAGTNRAVRMTVYDGNQSWGAGYINTASGKMGCARIQGNLTINSGFTLYPQVDSYGIYLYVDGDLTVNGSISTYNYGQSRTSTAGALYINGTNNEIAGSTTITLNHSAGSHSNGSSTSSSMQNGGGGQGRYGSYGRGNGNVGHTFSGGSGGGGGGGVAYYNHYQGGGSGGGTATSYARNGGGGGNSGYTKWGYWTQDVGGSGGVGNPGGSAGANNSRNGSDSRAGRTGHTGTPAPIVLYATGNITIASGGGLYTNGRAGQSGYHSPNYYGGGGGGGGGAAIVAVCGGTFSNSGTINRAGGSVGAGRGSGAAGGSGGLLTGGGYS
jgi:hypothetical protein